MCAREYHYTTYILRNWTRWCGLYSSGSGIDQCWDLLKKVTIIRAPLNVGSSWIHSFIHSFSSLSYDRSASKTSSPNRRSRASSFKWEYPHHSLRSSSSFLCRLPRLPRLPVTSIPPFIFPSITRCRRQFLSKMWPIQLALRYLFHVGYSSAPWLYILYTSNKHPSFSRY